MTSPTSGASTMAGAAAGETVQAGGRVQRWAGWVCSAIPILMFVVSGVMKITQPVQFLETWSPKLGWPLSLAVPIAVVELGCAVIYLVPRTAVLGAILATGYLGGAVATHVRTLDNFVPPVIVGVLVWAGLYLRDARLRALLPLRRDG